MPLQPMYTAMAAAMMDARVAPIIWADSKNAFARALSCFGKISVIATALAVGKQPSASPTSKRARISEANDQIIPVNKENNEKIKIEAMTIFLEPNRSDTHPAISVMSALLKKKLLKIKPVCDSFKWSSLLIGMMTIFIPNSPSESMIHPIKSSANNKYFFFPSTPAASTHNPPLMIV